MKCIRGVDLMYRCRYSSNKRGVSTVELLLIMAALVSAAMLFKSSLIDFIQKAAEMAFKDTPQVEWMTFGGETKHGKEVAPIGGRLKLPVNRAMPVTPSFISRAGERDTATLDAVLNQFKVETALRYHPLLNRTFCNIFAWDATSAMNAEIPHWIDKRTQMPYTYDPALTYNENARLANEVRVNTLYDWMQSHSSAIGYREVAEEEARRAANSGKPAVGIWKNPDPKRSGHIVVLRPFDPDKGGDPNRTFIAQAGSNTHNYASIDKVFKSDKMKTVKFYVHE